MEAITSEQRTGQSVVQHDRFDATAFATTRAQFEPLEEIAATDAMPEAETFTEDMFQSFYKAAPQLASEESLNFTAQVRRRLIDEVMNTAEYQRVRAMGTAGDTYSSGMATAATAYEIIDRLDQQTKDQLRDLQGFEQEAEQLFKQAEALAQEAGQRAGTEAEEMASETEQLTEQGKQAEAQAEALHNTLQANMERIEDTARRAARESLKHAGDEIKETNDAMAAYGGYSYEQSQAQTRMSTKEKMQLANQIKNNKKLARIAELAGKMVNTALQKQRNKVIHPPDEIIGITIGDDLARVLPSELILLDDELTEMLFYQRFVERSLMQYDMIGHEMQTKGAIIACVDESGSMNELLINARRLAKKTEHLSEGARAVALRKAYADAYTKEIWSKAVVLALLAIARHQHRDFCVVYFSSFGELKRYTFPKAKATTHELIDLATFFWGGGTTFDGWMTESLVIAEHGPFEHADVIVISDGDVSIREEKRKEFNARRLAKKMHCYGVLLDTNRHTGENLASVTDQMITITDLERDGKALDMLFTI